MWLRIKTTAMCLSLPSILGGTENVVISAFTINIVQNTNASVTFNSDPFLYKNRCYGLFYREIQ